MIWRVLLSALYAGVVGALMALENADPGMPDALPIAVWLAAPVVGFLVGRWWVLFAVVGALAGRTVGWDSGENDGNPALWPPYVLTAIVFLGLPLLLGVVLSQAWRGRHRSSIGGTPPKAAVVKTSRSSDRVDSISGQRWIGRLSG